MNWTWTRHNSHISPIILFVILSRRICCSRSCSGWTRSTSSSPRRPYHRSSIDRWTVGQHSRWTGWCGKYPSRWWTLVIPCSLVGRYASSTDLLRRLPFWNRPRHDLRHIPLVPPSLYLLYVFCVHNDVSFICLFYIIINACHFGEEPRGSSVSRQHTSPLVRRQDYSIFRISKDEILRK